MQGHLAGRFDSHDVAIDFNCYHIRIVVDGKILFVRGNTYVEETMLYTGWLDDNHAQVLGLLKFLEHALWTK